MNTGSAILISAGMAIGVWVAQIAHLQGSMFATGAYAFAGGLMIGAGIITAFRSKP